jgi:two-component sensor histidine kinase
MFPSAASPAPGPANRGLARELSSARARLESQERQIQELNHRVANSLQLAADMLTFEQLRSRDPMATAALEASRARLVAVGELHRYLYDHADRPSVDLRPFLSGLCQAVSDTTGLACMVDADATTVNGDMAQQLAIAINEFAINAAKHAYEGRPGGRLEVKSRREGAELVLTVADAGKGLADGAKPGSAGGLGMSIVSAIVRDLRGTLTVSSAAGAVFTIRAPLPAPPQNPNRSFQPWNLD